ncbi:tyrosine-type recombinase/integrase [Methylocapsa palsarum]|uniref:Site-specific recombinase XerD n=1 Tax=Methylocapsa palsarum TaxID=1612308 RepID=A0A1I3ZNQ8_9HYPH|nr:tyrosine-type recombinase/integrase [Methylocapsa palsarum]SFK45774.1 Site-specific recombinase XerD [Methylocapsa palsarum]
MTKPNAENERQKRAYFAYLREAHGRDNATIDRVAASLARFEASTRARGFRRFHREQAVAFKAKLSEAINSRTGERLSKATLLSTLRDLRAFFLWLAQEPGYRSKIAFSDADYFNLSDKDVAIARASRKANPPTLEQMRRVLEAMPIATVWERRDRALVAFACLTSARAAALASFRLGHVNVSEGVVEQDARTVRTKFAKTFRTDFHRLVPGAAEIVANWCAELVRDHAWGPDDPLFPQSHMGLAADGGFTPIGLARKGWASSQPVRDAFKRAYAAADLPYKKPHLMRDMLVHSYMSMDLTPAQLKAVSQSLGHSDVLTTFTSYGQLPTHRQSELIRSIAERPAAGAADPWSDLEAAFARVRAGRE